MEEKNKRFLVADTDENFIKEIKNMLEKNGYVFVGSAADGIDAVSDCVSKLPDIVFLKSDLSFVDGFKTCACLRDKDFWGFVVIIGEGYSVEYSKKAAESGADGFIAKPVTEKFIIPWLFTKLTRTGEKRELFEKKKNLLSELENRRIESEALGIIASSMNISIAESRRILENKAASQNMSFEEITKLVMGREE